MAIYPNAILGMIEIDSSSDVLTINTTGSNFTLTPNRNTYANVIDLMKDLNDEFGANGDLFLMRKSNYAPGTYDTDFVPVIELATGDVTSITAGTIKDILFSAFTTDASRTVADVTPLYSWIPDYRSKDANWFEVESGSIVKGSIGVSGNLSGISYTPRSKITKEWNYITKNNTFSNSDISADMARSFETVINDARSNSLQYQASGNIYCKGVYYIDNINTYLGNGSLTDTWVDGYPNSTSSYVFCTADAPQVGGASTDRLDTYYDVTLTLTTGTAPDWDNS